MNYTIHKIENGNLSIIHRYIPYRETAREYLECIANENLRQGKKVKKLACSVIIDDGAVTYMIGE